MDKEEKKISFSFLVYFEKYFIFQLGFDFFGVQSVFFHNSHEISLFFGRLESTVTELGCRVNEFQVDLFECNSLCLSVQRFAQRDWAFTSTHAAAFEHQEIVSDRTVLWKTALDKF